MHKVGKKKQCCRDFYTYLYGYLHLYGYGYSSHYQLPKQPPQMLFKIVVLKNFTIFTGKHLRWILFLITLQAQACNFVKKRLQRRCFPVNIGKFSRATFSQITSGGCFFSYNSSLMVISFDFRFSVLLIQEIAGHRYLLRIFSIIFTLQKL